jgi:hypothetical protein
MWDPVCVFGAVAQWSEQGTHNPWVVGSIPTRPTSVTWLSTEPVVEPVETTARNRAFIQH